MLITGHPVAVLGMMQVGIAAPWSVTLEGKVDAWQPNKDHFRHGFQRRPCSAEAGRALGACKMFLREQMSLVSREGGTSLPLRIWALRAVPPVLRNLALGVNDTHVPQRAALPECEGGTPLPKQGAREAQPFQMVSVLGRGCVCVWGGVFVGAISTVVLLLLFFY